MTSVLQELRITGLGVIDEAALELHPGLTVVTGETGAGKTMIVTALELVTGGRAVTERVRAGTDRAVVEARFAIDPDGTAARTAAAAGGRLDDDGSVIAVRSVGSDGRSRAHVGGRSAPVATLVDLTEPLVAVHGQADATSLLRPARQRAVLDRFAAADDDLARYRGVRQRWLAQRADLADRRTRSRERALREQMLRLAVAEIATVAPEPAEDTAVLAAIRALENVDGLRAAAHAALTAVVGAEELADSPTAVGLVAAAQRALHAADDARLADLAGQLAPAAAVLADVGSALGGYLGTLDADPDRLAHLLQRQAALRTLTRRYAPDADGVRAWAADAERELAELDDSEHRLAELAAGLQATAAELADAAGRLSARRVDAARRLGDLVTAELAHLAMGRAQVRVAVTRRPAAPAAGGRDDPSEDTVLLDGVSVAAGADGVDRVELLLTSHDGAPELPVARSASGGELSRVMLAVEVALAGADPVGTLVFDEVDSGVGGRAASEIGRRLALLARTHQVIVVTHLAQVAAYADRHYVVDAGSTADGGRIGASDVRAVTGADRELELARMLAGGAGATARAHARDLLAAPGGRSTSAGGAAPADRADIADPRPARGGRRRAG